MNVEPNNKAWSRSPSTIASAAASNAQRRAASYLCLAVACATLILLPFASSSGPIIPGFMLINQTSLIFAYGLSAWVLFAQFRRGRSLPLLLAFGGTLYTAAIVTCQLLSLPNITVTGRILGSGPETTLWLWTFWHLGPPLVGLAYATAVHGRAPRLIAPNETGRWAAFAALLGLAAAGASAGIATLALPFLPHQVTGDDYTDLITSGVGPAVQLLTIVALVAVWRATTGQRTVLEIWIAAGLALLVLDNLLTMVGSARGSIGWYAGRLEALISAFVILWAYLHEIDVLHARAEAAAEEVARAEAALRQAQKMEAIGRLTGGIAHDFNNLLTVVCSSFEMIQRRPNDAARVAKLAGAGFEATQRGAKLTRQLLTFASRGNLRPETVNPNALLLDFEPLLQRAIGEAIKLDLALDSALPPARLDRTEFEAAVLNLIVNARDAVSNGAGRITVSTRSVHQEQSASIPGSTGDLPAGSYAIVSVADNGAGMDEATLLQAFEPFFTTKEFGKGSGLGLSQVYGFVRAAGGVTAIHSKPGAGTTVELWLPRAHAREASAIRLPPGSPASMLRVADDGETILAVEDEPAVLAAAVESLADLGYRVLTAHDAVEAMERLRSEDRVDILFSDVIMPGGMNGVQLAVEAKRLRPGLRVLLTSGYTNQALADEHKIPADIAVLSKPYQHEELAKSLKVVSGTGA